MPVVHILILLFWVPLLSHISASSAFDGIKWNEESFLPTTKGILMYNVRNNNAVVLNDVIDGAIFDKGLLRRAKRGERINLWLRVNPFN